MSRGRHPSAVSFADLAIDRFKNWPLTPCDADIPPGRALSVPGRQIVHLHRGDLAEVHLTRPVIKRLTPVLTSSGRVDTTPDSAWAQVHLHCDNDLFLLESLVSLAIHANDPVRRGSSLQDCPFTRFEPSPGL